MPKAFSFIFFYITFNCWWHTLCFGKEMWEKEEKQQQEETWKLHSGFPFPLFKWFSADFAAAGAWNFDNFSIFHGFCPKRRFYGATVYPNNTSLELRTKLRAFKIFFNKRFNVNTFNMFVISVLSDERRLAFHVLCSANFSCCLDNAFWIDAENKKSLCKQKLLQRDNTCQLKGWGWKAFHLRMKMKKNLAISVGWTKRRRLQQRKSFENLWCTSTRCH